MQRSGSATSTRPGPRGGCGTPSRRCSFGQGRAFLLPVRIKDFPDRPVSAPNQHIDVVPKGTHPFGFAQGKLHGRPPRRKAPASVTVAAPDRPSGFLAVNHKGNARYHDALRNSRVGSTSCSPAPFCWVHSERGAAGTSLSRLRRAVEPPPARIRPSTRCAMVKTKGATVDSKPLPTHRFNLGGIERGYELLAIGAMVCWRSRSPLARCDPPSVCRRRALMIRDDIGRPPLSAPLRDRFRKLGATAPGLGGAGGERRWRCGPSRRRAEHPRHGGPR